MALPVDVLARVPLLPVLLGQGVMVRRRALRLPEPPGAHEGSLGAGPELRVLFIGDSSAAGVGAATQADALSGQVTTRLSDRFRVQWQLVAQTGATTRDAQGWLDALAPQRFDIAVVSLGVNDVTAMVPTRRWVGQQRHLAATLANRFGVQTILASGLPPMGRFPLLPQPLRWILGAQATRLDKALARMAQDTPGLHHIRVDYPDDHRYMAEDGYHASALAYALWAKVLASHISD